MAADIDTKMTIFYALDKLMKSYSINDVKVKDICRYANISRQTFYRHFKDKFDVGLWHFDEIMQRTLGQVGRTLTWKQAHEQLFTEIAKQKSFYQKIWAAEDYNSVHAYGDRASKDAYIRTITECIQVELTEDILFQLDVYCEIAAVTTRKWGMGGMKIHPVRLAELYDKIIPSELHALMHKNLQL